MAPAKCVLMLVGLAVWTPVFSESATQERARAQAERDRAALRQFPEISKAAKGVSPIIDKAARNHAESSVRSASKEAMVKSRDRPANSPIASAAHNRGAIDAVSPNMKRDAAAISKKAGPGYTTIHEQPTRTAKKSYDTHTIYQGGKQVNQTKAAPRATAEHIHVQPDFNGRLHNATNPPFVAPPKPQPKPSRSSERAQQ